MRLREDVRPLLIEQRPRLGAAFETPLNPRGDLPAPVFYGSPNIESDLFGTGFSEEILGAQEGRVYSMQSWDDPIEIAAN